MKKLFRTYASCFVMAILASLYFSSCKNLDSMDGMEEDLVNAASDTRADECDLIINGLIVNTKNLEPIAGVSIKGTSFSTTTNSNGEFSVTISVDDDGVMDDITVSKDGFLDHSFKAYTGSLVQLNDCPAVTNISWDIGLSERQEGVWVGPKDGAWYKIMDTVATRYTNENGMEEILLQPNMYVIDIRRGSVNDWRNVYISPNNNWAVGPGIAPDLSVFKVAQFDIDVLGKSGGFQEANSEEFLKPIDIRFQLPIKVHRRDFSVLDRVNLSVDPDPLSVSIDPDGNLVYLETYNGQFCIVYKPILDQVILPALEAIKNGASLEEINKIIADGLAAVGNAGNGLGGGKTEIDTDTETSGNFSNTETFSNCDCGPSRDGEDIYSLNHEGTEQIRINFPASATPADRAKAISILRALFGASRDFQQSVNLPIDLNKCRIATVTSTDVIRTASGTVLGYPFTYTSKGRLETRVEFSGCPTLTPCHQGCPIGG